MYQSLLSLLIIIDGIITVTEKNLFRGTGTKTWGHETGKRSFPTFSNKTCIPRHIISCTTIAITIQQFDFDRVIV